MTKNEFVKLVHLVAFITKKFVTMHGHMNVKLITAYSEVFDSSSKTISSAEKASCLNLVQCFAKCVPHTSKSL